MELMSKRLTPLVSIALSTSVKKIMMNYMPIKKSNSGVSCYCKACKILQKIFKRIHFILIMDVVTSKVCVKYLKEHSIDSYYYFKNIESYGSQCKL